MISTGVDGPADFTFFPLSFTIVLILPIDEPTIIVSPTSNLPLWTSIVATGPLDLSSLASITAPLACFLGFTFNSSISACNKTISNKSSIPIPFLAEIGTNIVSPPHSSGTSSYSINPSLTFCGSAPGKSILFIATIIGISAAFAWFIASIVCGITPSFAATTKIAISVICAPLALMLVKASCPGVSKNVISLSLTLTLYAPICWVIPPASPSITFVFLIASNNEVFPWSTCPITTTTGGLLIKSSSLSSLSSNKISSSVFMSFFFAVIPYSEATRYAISKSISLLIVAITPKFSNFVIRSPLVIFISAAKSLTEITGGIVISVNLNIFCLTLFSGFTFFSLLLPRSVLKS